MTFWITLAASAQLLSAVVTFVDRYVLTHVEGLGKPVVYAFYIGLLSCFVLVLVPFGYVSVPSAIVLELSLIVGVVFISSLLLLYSALTEGHASDVMPVVAAFSAITSLVLASQYLNEHLPPHFLFASALFVLGTLIISHFRFTKRSLMLVLCAGIFFGLTAFLNKIIFTHTTFVDGFFWSRMANVVGALLLLLWPGNMAAIRRGVADSSQGTRWLVVGNKTLAGIATAATLLAISLGSVSVVNAMSGLQFLFLPLIALMFSPWFPTVLRGEIFHSGIVQKLAGILCMIGGMILLYLA